MIIADLTHLENLSEEFAITGGLLNYSSNQFNTSVLVQSANAAAGNGAAIAFGNVAVALNIGVPIQVNI